MAVFGRIYPKLAARWATGGPSFWEIVLQAVLQRLPGLGSVLQNDGMAKIETTSITVRIPTELLTLIDAEAGARTEVIVLALQARFGRRGTALDDPKIEVISNLIAALDIRATELEAEIAGYQRQVLASAPHGTVISLPAGEVTPRFKASATKGKRVGRGRVGR